MASGGAVAGPTPPGPLPQAAPPLPAGKLPVGGGSASAAAGAPARPLPPAAFAQRAQTPRLSDKRRGAWPQAGTREPGAGERSALSRSVQNRVPRSGGVSAPPSPPSLLPPALKNPRRAPTPTNLAEPRATDVRITVYAWGRGDAGQLGLGLHDAGRRTPAPVQPYDEKDVLLLSGGPFHTAAVTADGEVYVSGAGESGQLGRRDRAPGPEPRRVDALDARKVLQCLRRINFVLFFFVVCLSLSVKEGEGRAAAPGRGCAGARAGRGRESRPARALASCLSHQHASSLEGCCCMKQVLAAAAGALACLSHHAFLTAHRFLTALFSLACFGRWWRPRPAARTRSR